MFSPKTGRASRPKTNNGRAGWHYLSIFAVVVLALAGLAACADADSDDSSSDNEQSSGTENEAATTDESGENDDRISVAVTMPFMPSMVDAVGGDLVEIESIVPEGTDAHSYQPSPGDAQLIADADIIFVNGSGLEEFLDDLIESAGNVEAPVIELADGLAQGDSGTEDHDHDEHDESEGDDHDHEDEVHEDEHHDDDGDHDEAEGDDHEHDHEYEGGNPHFWLNPEFGIHYVENIADGLSAIDPDNEDTYRENADSYIAEIEEFDDWAQEQMAEIPDENRSMVTFHDAFPHFAEHYDLEIVGVVISSPGREPGAQEIAQLADEIQDVGVPAVFIEPQFNPSTAESIADEAGVETVVIYSDTPPEGAGYLEMMELNVENVVEGLN